MKIKYYPKCKTIYTLIVKPKFGCSTKKIYSKVKKFEKKNLIIQIKKCSIFIISKN